MQSYQSELATITSGPSGKAQKLGIAATQKKMDDLVASELNSGHRFQRKADTLAAINDALRRICDKFGDSLKGFKLAPSVVSALRDLQQSE